MPHPRRFSHPARTSARTRSSKTILFTLLAALACGLPLYSAARPAGATAAAAQAPLTGLVNVTESGASSSQGFFGGTASVTPDGCYVCFTSTAPDLVPVDT